LRVGDPERTYPHIATLRKIPAARSIVEAAMRPLKYLTEQAESRHWATPARPDASRQFVPDFLSRQLRRKTRVAVWLHRRIDLAARESSEVGVVGYGFFKIRRIRGGRGAFSIRTAASRPFRNSVGRNRTLHAT
jgi:hypothetical protein